MIPNLITANATSGYSLVSYYSFDDATDSTTYAPAGLPSGVSYTGDYGFVVKGFNTAFSGKSIRFPTSAESGGSGNSWYRAQQANTYAYLNGLGLWKEGRVTYYIYFPTVGCRYRNDGQGETFTPVMFYFYGSALRNFVCMNGKSQLGILAKHSISADVNIGTANKTLDIGGYNAPLSWHKIDIRWKNDVNGYYKVIWDDSLKMSWWGNTDIGNAGTLYITHPGGMVSDNNNKIYFSAMDEVRLYKKL